jgi:hypothetical protein
MQRDVSAASHDLVSNEAKSRQHQSEMHRAITVQQTEVQRGLEQLEKERKVIAGFRLIDLLTSQTLTAFGGILAAIVPLGLLAWLFRDVHKSDSDLDTFIAQTPPDQPPVYWLSVDEFKALPSARPLLGHQRDDLA